MASAMDALTRRNSMEGLFDTHGKDIKVQAITHKRIFKSAKASRLYPVGMQVQPIDVDIHAGLRALVSRSRHEAQNNDYFRQFLRECRTNIVGHQGIVFQAKTLGTDNELDIKANSALEDAWREWGRYGSPEITGTLSLKMMLRLMCDSVFRDGEILILKHPGWRDNKYRFAVQMLDPQSLDVLYNRNLKKGHVIRMGVEFNAVRRPVAYHVLQAPNTSIGGYSFYGKKYIRYPAERIYHRFLPEWVWQSRGIPGPTTCLLRMNMVSGYEEAELTAARVAAAKMGFYITPEGEAPPGTEDESGDEEKGDFVQDAEPGHFEILPTGYTLESWDPQHPNTAFKDFMKTMLRGVASGLGVNYNTLANDLEGVNYSSLRHGTLVERAVWMLLQDWMIESIMQPMYEDWLEPALLTGEITVSGSPLRVDRIDKYKRVFWQGRRWPWVDPQKEMNANRIAISGRFRSISSVIREQGEDPEEVFQEISNERKRLEELEIPLDEAAFAALSISGDEKDDEAIKE